MLPQGKRLKLSFVSVASAGAIVGLCHYLINAVILTYEFEFNLAEFVYTILGFTIICYPGWIFAIPLVLLVKRLSKRGFWIWLIAGSAVGPIVITLFIGINTFINTVLLPTLPAHHSIKLPVAFLYCYSWAASGLSSLFYLLLFRRAERALELKTRSAGHA